MFSNSEGWLGLESILGPIVTVCLYKDLEFDANRVQRSDGTYGVTNAQANRFNCDIQARLPLKPWRDLETDETRRLIRFSSSAVPDVSVYILKVPDNLVECALQLSRREHRRGSTEGDNTLKLFDRQLREFCSVEGDIDVRGVEVNRPSLESVSLNSETGRFLGLHVDSWDSEVIGRRSVSRKRMSINIGRVRRFFQYVPFALDNIGAHVGATSVGIQDSITPFARVFLSEEASIPVVRCRINPGEAYIAPTENIIHDGSSAGAVELGMHFTILGHINPH
jgi:hypothetical protein